MKRLTIFLLTTVTLFITSLNAAAPKKIVISGNCGSGKTTLAKMLSKELNVPIFHLDKMYWKPGWKKCSKEEFQQKHSSVLKNDSWIIEGPYASGLQERCKEADVVLFLDRSPLLCSWRVIKRMCSDFRTKRSDLNKGNFYGMHITKVILKNIWLFSKHHKPRLMNIIEKNAPHKLHILASNSEIKKICEQYKNT